MLIPTSEQSSYSSRGVCLFDCTGRQKGALLHSTLSFSHATTSSVFLAGHAYMNACSPITRHRFTI
eukprot:1138021-Pelagomonas_calceolata.AAC.2